MSLQVIDVESLRRRAEHDQRLTRAVESREISERAASEKESKHPFAGLLKTKPPPSEETQYVYREYLTGCNKLLARAADTHCHAEGAVEKEIAASKDIEHGVTALLGGGTYSDVLGTVGALCTIVSSHKALRLMSTAPPPPQQEPERQSP